MASRQVIHNAADYVFIKNTDLVYLIASKRVAIMAGFTDAEDLVGKTDFEIFPRNLAEKYQADDKEVMASGRPMVEHIEQLPDMNGQSRWTKTWKYPLFDESGQICGVYGISRDISHEVGLEQEAATTKKYAELINHIPGGIGILRSKNDSYYLDYANAGWFQVHNIDNSTGQSLLGCDVFPFIYGPDQKLVLETFQQYAKNPSDMGSATYRYEDATGTIHWIKMRFRFAYTENNVQYYYATVNNLDDQKKTEEQLAASQQALQEAITNSDLQFFTYFPGQPCSEIHITSNRLSELPTRWENFPDDFLSYTQASPEDQRAYRKMLEDIDAGANEAECIVRFCYQGIWTWEKVHLKAIRDSEGNIIKALGYSVNITHKKKIAEQLRSERVRAKTLEGSVFEAFSFNLSKNSEPFFNTTDTIDLDQPIPEELAERSLRLSPALTHANTATRNVLLHAANRIPNPKEQDLFITTCSGNALQKALSTAGSYKTKIRYRRRVKGIIRWVSTTAEVLSDPDSGDFIAFYYTQDINEEIIQEKILDQLVDRNYAALSFYDVQTKNIYIKGSSNDNLASYNGLPYTDALDDAMTRVPLENADEVRPRYEMETIMAELEKHPEYIAYYPTTELAKELPGAPLRQMKSTAFYLDENRDIIVFVVSDVTEIFEREREHREKLGAALTAAEQASLAKTEFLSRMSHEIRTPMNAIIGLDAIALQEKNLSTTMEDHLQKIGISARFLLSLINDILDMSRIESGRMLLKNEIFNFEELINSINTILYEQCRENSIDYDCVLKSSTETTYVGDAIKLQQLLVNILGNAVKFTPKGGKIHFMIEELEHTKDNARLRFEIADTGIGIDEKFIPHLFEPFTQEERGRTSTYKGTGLGLAISKKIVDLMAGDISVYSIKNVGSQFTVEVPLALSPESKNRRERLPYDLKPLYTLIVDDDIIVCRHTQLILQEAGLKTEWIDSGRGAVNKIYEQHQAKQDYDLILLDWKMPDMDGIETARKIRKIVGPDVTIIIMTAYDWANIEIKARAAGVDMFMKKPIFANSVKAAFENVFLNRKDTPIPSQPAPNYDFSSKRVLLVEDNEINAEIAQSLLEMKYCTVELARNGAEAVESFAAAPLGYYDAILMDVRMPIMDGLEATKAIRAMRKASSKTIPIIAMTANAFQEDVNISLACGMNAHLAKPIEPDTLYATLAKFLHQKK